MTKLHALLGKCGHLGYDLLGAAGAAGSERQPTSVQDVHGYAEAPTDYAEHMVRRHFEILV